MKLLIDGMLSGTGIRDAIAGGYVDHTGLSLPADLLGTLNAWLSDYEDAHYRSFDDANEIAVLDERGLSLARQIAEERPEDEIGYFSNGLMRRLA